jgi:hypothetical protein
MFAPTRTEDTSDPCDIAKESHGTAAAKNRRGKSTLATDNIFMTIDAEKIES